MKKQTWVKIPFLTALMAILCLIPSLGLAQNNPEETPAATSDSLNADQIEQAAAEKYAKAKVVYDQVIAIQLYDPAIKDINLWQQQKLQEKFQLLEKAIPAFIEVIDVGPSKYAIFSIVRMGMMYQDISDKLAQVPPPPDVDKEVAKAYHETLKDYRSQFATKAIGLYLQALEVQKENHIEVPETMITDVNQRLAVLQKDFKLEIKPAENR